MKNVDEQNLVSGKYRLHSGGNNLISFVIDITKLRKLLNY